MRFKSDVLEFNQMSELLNQKSSVQAKVPSGYLNAIFDLSGSWLNDAADTKYLAFDGYFVSLYYLHLTTSPLLLQNQVKNDVPPHWDPSLLSRFIQIYGTHIIVGMGVGGHDLLCVKQRPSSAIPPAELKGYLDDLGDYLFSDGTSPLPERDRRDGKKMVPEVFSRMLQSHTMQFTSITETSSKDGLTVIWSKRGGDLFAQSHLKWLQTLVANSEGIFFKLVPITSLLAGIPGSGYLSHAINLYLRYKPALEDLQYFLEFQIPRQWAPLFSELPLGHHQRRKVSCPSLQFSLFGPKIEVNSTQVSSCKKPVIGMRLFLEGNKCNRVAVHVQHLSSLPNILTPNPTSTTKPCQWRGSDDYESSNQFLEAVRWKSYAKVCSSVVKHDPSWIQAVDSSGVFVVTGAQLISTGKWPKRHLHLRLLYTHLPNCTIRKTEWAAAPESSCKSSFLTNLSTTFTLTQRTITDAPPKHPATTINSGVYPDGPPVPVCSTKLLKYVDTTEVVRGPNDAPGHWLVTAAKLVIEGGKIGLHAKFALLDYH
ncbi:unnamed protein product [Cuscuta europaea]|uniref:MACPF domain-containing protein n=1 Tax=Cuscuta europaea TaxID=41803 RepID=A0A9P0ZRG9_CUSEU|nr:unnamed protein product [Cuscuta europaea]